MYEIVEHGYRVSLDREPQRLRLDVEAPDFPFLQESLPLSETHVCAGELMYRAKQIDDGLVAALELAAQRGLGKLQAKSKLLLELAKRSADPLLHAACILGGLKKAGGFFSRKGPGQDEAKALLADQGKTKPLGFYTWSKELQQLFRQDRALQEELDAPAVLQVLRAAPELMRAYQAQLRFAARIANPPAEPDLFAGGRFLPTARAPERTLGLALYGNAPIPEGFELMRELVARVRGGKIDLTPGATSGFYDHQLAPLAALLAPERNERLESGAGWEKRLEDLARAAWALARETQIKQLDAMMMGSRAPRVPPRRVHLRPALRVEPLPAYYALRATSYRFLREQMAELIGEAALDGIPRLTPDGPGDHSVLQTLRDAEALFRGAHAAALEDLGLPAPPGASAFSEWMRNRDRSNDDDQIRDGRMMVPVFFDVQRRKYKVWAMLGWVVAGASVEFTARPRVVSVDRLEGQPDEPELVWTGDNCAYWQPVMVETYVSELLDRDEFRALCDTHRSQAEILRALQS